MEKSNDSVCSFSPSPLTHRQLNCQTPFPGSSFPEPKRNSSTDGTPFPLYIYLFIPPKSHQNTRSVHRKTRRAPKQLDSLRINIHTQKHTGNDSLLFFGFFFFRSLKWLTNTKTSQCLPLFSSSLSLSPLVASHRNEVAARYGSGWCVKRLSCPSPISLLSLYSAERAALCHLHKLLYLLALLKDSPHSFKEIRTTR